MTASDSLPESWSISQFVDGNGGTVPLNDGDSSDDMYIMRVWHFWNLLGILVRALQDLHDREFLYLNLSG